MKKIILTAVLILFGLSANADANTDFAKRVGGYFYTSLAPHGTWIEIGFGTPVWRPTMIRKSWAPYRQDNGFIQITVGTGILTKILVT
jgi:hypothetical protein